MEQIIEWLKTLKDIKLPGNEKMMLLDYLIHMVLVIAITYSIIFIIKSILHQFFLRTDFIEEKKEQTIESIFKNTSGYIAAIIIILSAIQPFFDLKQILVAGGVLGIVIGFGAQTLISDIFTGFFLLFEKQFQKGDFVHINDELEGGTVEELGFRVVKIRQLNGKLMVVPNGQIKKVVNGNINKRRIFESVVISYREDPEKIKNLLEEVCAELNEKHNEILIKDDNGEIVEEYRYNGLSSLDSNMYGYKYTIVATIIDTEYAVTVREVKQLLAQKIYDNKIKMPEQQMYYQTRVKSGS